MMGAVLVALAGGLGAVTRFLVDAAVAGRHARPAAPLGTTVINVTGSLVLGLLTGWWSLGAGEPGVRLALGTGFLGGYTTFSTASVEVARLTREGLQWRGLVHGLAMLVGSLVGALLGFVLGALLAT